jgi:hypothetical protein
VKWLAGVWADNGTKILGALLTVGRLVYAVSDDSLELIPPGSHVRGIVKLLLGILGYLVVQRGTRNSRPPPP